MADDKSVSSRKYRADIDRARREGHAEGLAKGRQEILDWLQRAYIDDMGRPDRGSAKAEAILELAREASTYFKRKARRRAGRK